MNKKIITELKEKVNKLERDNKTIKCLLNVLEQENNKCYIVGFDKRNNKYVYECPICKNKIFQKYLDKEYESKIVCDACGISITLNDFINPIYFKCDDFSLTDIMNLLK